MRRIFKRMSPGPALLESPVLRPFSPYLDRHFLWQFNRRNVALGVAAGLFFGILFPVAQIFFAALGSIIFRANLPVAAFSTFVTNPFTVPPLYYLAYRVGDYLIGFESHAAVGEAVAKTFHSQLTEAMQSLPMFMEWVGSFGLSLMLGLGVFSVVASIAGYFAVNSLWKIGVRLRWSRRKNRQACAA